MTAINRDDCSITFHSEYAFEEIQLFGFLHRMGIEILKQARKEEKSYFFDVQHFEQEFFVVHSTWFGTLGGWWLLSTLVY